MLSFDELNPTGPGGLSAGMTLLSTPGSSTSGVLLDHSTAGTLKVRTYANSADASITGLNATFSGTLTYGGVTLSSAVTGTGNLVLATGPTISSLTVTSTLTYGGVTLASAVTGTGNMVLATAPSVSSLTVTSTLTYGGVTLSSAVTGTGSMVLSAAPSLTGLATLASLSATGTGVFISGAVASAAVVQAIGIGSVAAFGIYFGAGTPSITTASTGSLYLNTTGSSTASRMFVFSSASTWIAVTTAS